MPMDTLHSVLFYALAAATVAGGLAAGLLDGRRRVYGLGVAGLGLAGLEADLDAWLPALATLLAVGAAVWLLDRVRAMPEPPSQAAGALAGVVLLALLYVAFRGSYPSHPAPGVGIVHFLFIGAFLFSAGLFLAGRRPSFAAALAGVPLLLGGAGLDLAAASRFGAGTSAGVAEQEFAVITSVVALAFAWVASYVLVAPLTPLRSATSPPRGEARPAPPPGGEARFTSQQGGGRR